MKIAQCIPYYRQSTDSNCGPAILRSLLYGLRRIKREEQCLAQELNTNEEHGTHPDSFLSIARGYGLQVISGTSGDIETLQACMKDGFVPVVRYFLPDENDFHYSIVSEIEENRIHLIDPWKGEDVVWKTDKFVENWYSLHGHRRWYAGFK